MIDDERLLARGSYFAEGHFVRTDPATGVARTPAGTRMLALTRDFLVGVWTALGRECGPEADAVLYAAGKKWGVGFAARLDSELSEFHGRSVAEFPLAVFQACLGEAFSHHGWGDLRLDLSHAARGVVAAEVRNCMYAGVLGTAERPADALTAGILAGMFAHFAGQDLGGLQTDCEACGADAGRFLVSHPARVDQVRGLRDGGAGHAEVLAALLETRAEPPASAGIPAPGPKAPGESL